MHDIESSAVTVALHSCGQSRRLKREKERKRKTAEVTYTAEAVREQTRRKEKVQLESEKMENADSNLKS